MTSLFFKTARSVKIRGRFCLRLRIAFAAAFVCSGNLFCQQSPAQNIDRNFGFIRIINLCPPGSPDLDFLRPTENPPEWISQIHALDYTSYAFFKPGVVQVQIKTSQSKETPVNVSVPVKEGGYYTIVTCIHDGKLTSTIQDDSYAFDKEPLGTVRVINGVPDTKATISLHAKSQPIFYLEPIVLQNLAKNARIQILIFDKNREIPFDLPLDFSQGRRTTVLIAKDTYGRIRPVSIYDGYSGDVFASSEIGIIRD